jgi:hypothetical protein
MINFITGLIAVVLLSLFAGGLAHSIWGNTGSIAFPIIVIAVLIMCYVDFFESLLSRRRKSSPQAEDN